ncbi:formylmethanofuran dehydrogenase subunit C [Thalassoroseus pseudoceratinae]|uniref:formylmethanofuran dehydrogenase subunit C n=1 Tax=Thalassoroseus pseudoceratinae TaxID=2713176 RepID=UPI001423DD73|nr:formylmethanofuran dehydrogenase subunit C [Thalassoroseus pseudoceratinae]
MPLVIELKESSSIPLEVDSISLKSVCRQANDEILKTPIQRGNKQVELGEFFHVHGSAADDNEMRWQGDLSKVKLIANKLESGRVVVEGNAGMHLGAEMTGGEITVHGDCADWLGAEMHGGRIRVHGNAGHLVGAAYRGGRRGMTGGEILIDGNAGNEVGHTMRRGLIAIGGRAGDAIAFNMIAGTVFVFGESGIRPGAGMRRGTIGLLGPESATDLLPTFQHACNYHPQFLTVYLRHLRSLNFPLPDDCFDIDYRRYSGDFLELGKGEILLRA